MNVSRYHFMLSISFQSQSYSKFISNSIQSSVGSTTPSCRIVLNPDANIQSFVELHGMVYRLKTTVIQYSQFMSFPFFKRKKICLRPIRTTSRRCLLVWWMRTIGFTTESSRPTLMSAPDTIICIELWLTSSTRIRIRRASKCKLHRSQYDSCISMANPSLLIQ